MAGPGAFGAFCAGGVAISGGDIELPHFDEYNTGTIGAMREYSDLCCRYHLFRKINNCFPSFSISQLAYPD